MPHNKWEFTTLDTLGKVESGKTLPYRIEDSHVLFENGHIPLIDGEAISKSRLYVKKYNRHLNFRGLRNNKLFPKNTVCIVRCGSSGDSALLKETSFLSDKVYGFNSYEGISDPKFIKYCFDYPRMKEKLMKLARSSTAQPVLSFQKLQIIKFPAPPPGFKD